MSFTFKSGISNNINSSNMGDNCRVLVRVRPPMKQAENDQQISTVQVSKDKSQISLLEYYNIDLVDPQNIKEYINNPNSYYNHQYGFDHIYDQDSTQQEVYEQAAKSAVFNTLEGYNATIMAYGQTGTGKTYTMEGFKYNQQDTSRGIIPRSIEEIFRYIEQSSDINTNFLVRTSYLQIYNDNISDLLKNDRNKLEIREDKKKGVFVENLSEWAVRAPSEIFQLIQKGSDQRKTAKTNSNPISSRSHAVFKIIVEQMTVDGNGKQIKVGKLNLVDLAGSERVRTTGATGIRLEECKKINSSLSCLGNVIAALTDSKGGTHIPYRDSKLTRLLEDSLGGNCKTTMLIMVSPAVEAFSETLASLKFGNRAKNIKNQAVINEDVDQGALLRKYESELHHLKKQLHEKNHANVDVQVKQLENDKRQAMEALDLKSKEFFQERQEKQKLKEKINQINSQMLVGGQKVEETQQFQNALEEKQKQIRDHYEKKLEDLEEERFQIEEDKAQVDKYKQLLLKQRDIMIALTTRLNERDETIVQLQEEVDAFDRFNQETEEMHSQKDEQLKEKENQIQIYQKQQQQHQQFEKNSLQDKLQIKDQVDGIIEALSQPNDPMKLQTVAQDLIKLQVIVNESIKQQQGSSCLLHNTFKNNKGCENKHFQNY